jgi:fibronectin-binding autotransporter adhesin
MNTKALLPSVLLAAGLVLPPAFAADKTWDRGGAVNNWTTPANWNLDTAPVAGDSLFFAGTGTGNSNDFDAFTLFNGITFNSLASGFTLSGNAITLGGNITNSSSNSQTIGLATILANNIAVNVNSTGSVNLNAAITGNQTITINGGTSGGVGTYLGSDSRHSFQGTLLVNGFLYSRAAAGGIIAPGATVNLGTTGTLDLRDRGATIGGLAGSAGTTARVNSGAQMLTIAGSGTYNFAGDLSNGTGTGLNLWVMMNYGAGKGGVQTFSGNNTNTGTTNVDSGKLVLDYSTNNTSKLSDTGLLTVRAGTIELVGGSHTEVVNNLTMSGSSTPAGMVNFVRSSGASVLQLGAIGYGDFTTGGGGAINFSTGGMATTTTGLVRGLLSPSNGAARITVAGADWATTSSGSIVAYSDYTAFVTSGGNDTLNYSLTGGSTATGNLNFSTLKIASSTGSAQTLALGNRTLGLSRNGLLVTGSDDYAITADAGAGLGTAVIHNYSTGVFSLGATTGILEHYGTGKTVLTAASSATTANNTIGLRLGSGTLQFSANNQLSGNGNLVLFGGNFIANTSGGNISLTNSAASGFRNITLGSDVPVIDVIGGGTLTIGGVIDRAFGNPNQYTTPVVYGSASSNGTIQVLGNNNYTGDTRLDGVRLSVNSNTSLGSTDAAYKVVFSRNSTLNTTANITTARYYDINSGVTGTIETDGSTTLTHSGTIAGAGNLRKTGAGTLTISGTSTYTGSTTIAAGTLVLDATGTIARSPVINLGTVGSQGTLDVTAKSAFTIGADQTLTGYGTVNIGTGKTVTIAGNLAPGNSPGITSVTGSLTLLSSAVTTMELGGLTAGTGFDQVVVSEALTYGGTLSIVSFGGWNINQVATYDLFEFASQSGNFSAVNVGATTLAFNAGTWSGSNGGVTYSLTMNDGVLSVIPEPGTWALLAFSLTAMMIFRRRRS